MDLEKNLKQIEANITENKSKGPKIGVRHIQCGFAFAMLAIGYAMRVNVSVAIVAMTTKDSSSNPDVPVYSWTDQSIILSSFYFSYFILQIPAGQLNKKFGPKWFLVVVMLMNGVACACTPIVAENFGSKGMMACRILQGLLQGFLFPSTHHLLSHWAPTSERSTIGGIVYGGCSIGTIIGMPITGWISSSWLGWPWSFYFFAMFALTWSIVYALYGANSPSEHKRISPEEKHYIESSLGQENHDKMATPWKDILTSKAFYAILSTNIAGCFSSTLLLTETPTYMNKVLGFNMSSNGLLSAAPSLAGFLIYLFVSPFCDFLINRNILSRVAARKVFNTAGTVGPGLILLAMGFIPKDQAYISVSLFIFNGVIGGFVICGYHVNHMDLSPNFGGVLMGLSNGIGNIFAIVSPMMAQYIVTDQTNQSQWMIVFIIGSVIYFVAAITFIIYGEAEIQSWNKVKENESKKKEHISEERLKY